MGKAVNQPAKLLAKAINDARTITEQYEKTGNPSDLLIKKLRAAEEEMLREYFLVTSNGQVQPKTGKSPSSANKTPDRTPADE